MECSVFEWLWENLVSLESCGVNRTTEFREREPDLCQFKYVHRLVPEPQPVTLTSTMLDPAIWAEICSVLNSEG